MNNRLVFVVAFGLLAGLAALLLAPRADACPPAYRSYSYTPYVAPTYYPTVKEIVTVAVAVPTVLVGAAPATAPVVSGASAMPAAAPAPSPCATSQAELAELRKELVELRRSIAQPATPAAANPAPSDPLPARNPKSIQALSCAVCHGKTADKDAVKGAKVYRFYGDDGDLLPDAPRGAMIRAAYNAEMPPPDNKKGVKPLQDQEVAALVQELGGK